MYIEGFCMWNVCFDTLCLNELTYIVSFIKLITMFSAVIMSLLMIIYSKKYKSKYPITVWWKIPCIMGELWKKEMPVNP